MHRHHVGVALDDDGLVPLGDVALGQVDTEQHRRLLVQQRLRRVDVLGFHRVVVEQPSRAEPDHLSGRRPDRPQQPAVEPVHRTAAALARQARRFELLEFKTLAQQMLCQGVPARRREAAAEATGGVGVEIALGQVRAGQLRLRRFQRRRIERLRLGVGGGQPAATSPIALHVGGRGAGVADGVPDPVGQQLDGLDKADVFDLLEEGIHVAALAAAEAVEVAVVGPHVERRRLLVVERAEALHRIRAGPAQLDVVADDFLDSDSFADGGDIAIRDAAGHRPSVRPPDDDAGHLVTGGGIRPSGTAPRQCCGISRCR